MSKNNFIFASMYSYAEENYLKTIYKLSEQGDDKINTNAIAGLIHTKAASVTDMLKKLSDKRLIKYEKYHGVSLTDKGKKVAVETVRKHRLWECFLYDKLQFGWDEVHEIAEQLEHIQSETLTDKLDQFLGNPTHDPHGDPIPSKTGELKKSDLIALNQAEISGRYLIGGVVDHSSAFLQHLNKLNFKLGTEIQLLLVNDFDGSMELKANKKVIHVSKDVAKNILVKELK